MVRVIMEVRVRSQKVVEFRQWAAGPEFARSMTELGIRNWTVLRPLSGTMADADGYVALWEFEVENLAALASVTGSAAWSQFAHGQLMPRCGGSETLARHFYTIDARG